MRFRVLYFTGEGMFFQGPRSLVKEPEAAQLFDVRREPGGGEVDLMLERVRDAIFLNGAGVTQVRIISEEFEVTP